jgi:hypothetical protein
MPTLRSDAGPTPKLLDATGGSTRRSKPLNAGSPASSLGAEPCAVRAARNGTAPVLQPGRRWCPQATLCGRSWDAQRRARAGGHPRRGADDRLEVRPAAPPAPIWWPHWRACTWTAAWLECRGREWLGQREVLELEQWSGQARSSDGRGRQVARHRPDLVARGSTPVEVELINVRIELLETIVEEALEARRATRAA